MKLGSIKVLEREDSYLLRPHENWNTIKHGNIHQCCGICMHWSKDDNVTCPVYNAITEESEGTTCGSFSVSISPDYYVVRDFIDLLAAYNLEKLNNQEWIL